VLRAPESGKRLGLVDEPRVRFDVVARRTASVTISVAVLGRIGSLRGEKAVMAFGQPRRRGPPYT
jgi:hypothetical protein